MRYGSLPGGGSGVGRSDGSPLVGGLSFGGVAFIGETGWLVGLIIITHRSTRRIVCDRLTNEISFTITIYSSLISRACVTSKETTISIFSYPNEIYYSMIAFLESLLASNIN